MKVKSLSHVRLFGTPWTVAYQTPPSMGLSRQEYWSGLPFPSPGDRPIPRTEPGSPTLYADALPSEPPTTIDFIFCHFPLKCSLPEKRNVLFTHGSLGLEECLAHTGSTTGFCSLD